MTMPEIVSLKLDRDDCTAPETPVQHKDFERDNVIAGLAVMLAMVATIIVFCLHG